MWRLCSQQKLFSLTIKKGRRGSGKIPGPAVHDDHAQREFPAPRPNAVWLTDITEHLPRWAALTDAAEYLISVGQVRCAFSETSFEPKNREFNA